jgi:hypothetical protein
LETVSPEDKQELINYYESNIKIKETQLIELQKKLKEIEDLYPLGQ